MITNDPRHRGLIRLIKRQVRDRAFANWSMAFQNLDMIPPDELKGFSPFLSGSLLDDAFRKQPENCYRLMLRFKETMLR